MNKIYNTFNKLAVGGHLNEQSFFKGMKEEVGIVDNGLLKECFAAFDLNKDGSINLQEFVGGLCVLLGGSLGDRMRLAFKAYDLDGNGVIDKTELFAFFRSSLSMCGVPVGQATLDQVCSECVEKCFLFADTNNDGFLTEDEFVRGVHNDQIIVSKFWRDPTTNDPNNRATNNQGLSFPDLHVQSLINQEYPEQREGKHINYYESTYKPRYQYSQKQYEPSVMKRTK